MAVVMIGVLVWLGTGATAHNYVDVFDFAVSEWSHNTYNYQEADSQQCDPRWTLANFAGAWICTGFETNNAGGSESDFVGFAYSPSSEINIHATCKIRIVSPFTDGTLNVKIKFNGLNQQTVCTRYYSYPTEETIQGDWMLDPGGPNVLVGQITERTEFINSWDPPVIDVLYWQQVWVRSSTVAEAAQIKDPSNEDYYLAIANAASLYVVADPSGTDQLVVGGVPIPVTDGVAVTVGPLSILRGGDPTLGPNGKTWTVTHPTGSPFSVEILPDGLGRTSLIKTYGV